MHSVQTMSGLSEGALSEGLWLVFPCRYGERSCFRLQRTSNDPSSVVSLCPPSPPSLGVQDISDLGTPEEAGQQLLKQFLTEFMSTRLGVRREPKLLRTNVRTTMDGDEYYEIEVHC